MGPAKILCPIHSLGVMAQRKYCMCFIVMHHGYRDYSRCFLVHSAVFPCDDPSLKAESIGPLPACRRFAQLWAVHDVAQTGLSFNLPWACTSCLPAHDTDHVAVFTRSSWLRAAQSAVRVARQLRALAWLSLHGRPWRQRTQPEVPLRPASGISHASVLTDLHQTHRAKAPAKQQCQPPAANLL